MWSAAEASPPAVGGGMYCTGSGGASICQPLPPPARQPLRLHHPPAAAAGRHPSTADAGGELRGGVGCAPPTARSALPRRKRRLPTAGQPPGGAARCGPAEQGVLPGAPRLMRAVAVTAPAEVQVGAVAAHDAPANNVAAALDTVLEVEGVLSVRPPRLRHPQRCGRLEPLPRVVGVVTAVGAGVHVAAAAQVCPTVGAGEAVAADGGPARVTVKRMGGAAAAAVMAAGGIAKGLFKPAGGTQHARQGLAHGGGGGGPRPA